MYNKLIYIILSALLLISMKTFAQSSAEIAKIKEKMWDKKDPDFSVREIKSEWKDRSAVIIAKSIEYEVRKEVFFTMLYENLYVHKRIKLLDKASVNKYSELVFDDNSTYRFAFNSAGNVVYAGIKIVKPNGKEKEVDLGESVMKEIQNGYYKHQYKKIAVADLEVGDIIDFYQVIKRTVYNNVFEPFNPIIYPLAEGYPIMKQQIKMNILRKCYLSAVSMNGAPELKESTKDEERFFVLNDQNREEVKDKIWMYQYREVPCLKFQAFYASGKGLRANPSYAIFLGEPNMIKKSATKEDVLRYINEYKGYYFYAGQILDDMNTNHKRLTDPEKFAKEAYYFFRQKKFMNELEFDYLNGSDVDREMSNREFVRTMSLVLTKKKIDHDIIITIPRPISDIKNLLLLSEIDMMIRVNSKTPVYLSDFTRYSQFNDLNSYHQGNSSYAVNMLTKKRKREIEEIIIPSDVFSKNAESNSYEVSLNEENKNQLNIDFKSKIKGQLREENLNVLTMYDVLADNKAKQYNVTDLPERKRKYREDPKRLQKKQETIQQDEEDRKKFVKKSLESELGNKIDSLISIEVTQTGLWDEKPELAYNCNYTLSGFSSKVGKNYLLSLGKLIGEQIKIEEEDKKRKENIYMPFSRQYEYNIVFMIPDGFKAKGLEKFNYNIVNETGGFISSAILKNNGKELHIKSRKYYNHNYEDAKKWPLMNSFLNAAFDFTQQKILLEKGEGI